MKAHSLVTRLLLPGMVGWALQCFAAHAIEVVGFDSGRAGLSSISSSAGYASTRSQIVTAFPGSTFVGVPTLTANAVQNADVVWLGVGFGDFTAIAPLTPAEQVVLRDFVLGGGIALLFGDNNTYSPAAQTVNDSFFGQFAVHSTGTLNNNQSYVLASPSEPPLSGPVGSVASLVSGFPGWFDVLPTEAKVITRLSANNNPSLVHIPHGALGAGSGDLWLFSDTGAQATGGTQGSEWTTLYANILSTSVTSADFDVDGDVDSADFLEWQRGVGIAEGATRSQGDADGNGAVDAADLNVWSNTFGEGAHAVSAIPEPTALAMTAFAIWQVRLQRCKRWNQTSC